MADYSITAANVKPVNGTTSVKGPFAAGAALTPGQSIFRHVSDNKWYMLDIDDPTAMANISTKPDSIGVLMFGGAAIDDLLYVAVKGPIYAGTTLNTLVAVYGSDTAGGLKPGADLDSGDVPVLMGTPLSTTILYLDPVNPVTALA